MAKKEKEKKPEKTEVETPLVEEWADDDLQTDEKGLKYRKIVRKPSGSTIVYR
jgi:hypothetical protein